MYSVSRKSFFTILITVLILGFSIYFFIANMDFGRVFNSDQISIPYLYKDLFQHHGLVRNWKFSFDNYFFPDTLIFFLANFFVNNARVAILLAESIILIGYYLSLVAVGALVCGEENKNLFRLSALLSLTLFSGHLGSLATPLLTGHFSCNVIVYLLEIFLIIKLLTDSSFRWNVLLVVLVFLTLFSDPLSLVVLVGSVLVAIVGLFRTVAKPQKIVLIKIGFLLSLIAVLNSFIIRLYPFHLNIVRAKLKFLFSVERAITLYNDFLNFYYDNPIIILIVFAHLVIAAWFFIKLNLLKGEKNFLNILGVNTLFIIFSSSSVLIILIFFSIAFDPDLTPGSLALLHFIPAILIPVFLGFPILLTKYTNIGVIANKYYGYFALILLANLLIFGVYKSFAPFVNYYPALTKCLDDYYQTGQLKGKNGLDEYWEAHPSSIFSKNDLNIVAVLADYQPQDWMSTKGDYLNKKFNFIILRTSTPDFQARKIEIKKFGLPHTILKCPGDDSHFIYTYRTGFSLPKLKP